MKAICALLLLAVAVSAQGNPRCIIGERGTSSDGTIVFDNAAPGVCYGADDQCAIFRYDLATEYGTMRVEFGTCMSRTEPYDCGVLERVIRERGYGNPSNCLLSVAASDDFRQFNPTPPQNCDVRNENDLHTHPSCTMRQALTKMADCANSYYLNFPYADTDQCHREVDGIFACYARVATECYSGLCPTIFDEVPGAREKFTMARDWSFNVTDLDSALANMVAAGIVNDTTGFKDMIHEVTCSPPGVVPSFVATIPEMWNLTMGEFFDESTMQFFNAIPCSENYWTKIGEAYMTAVNDMYSAMDKENVCSAFNEYKSETSKAFLMECDFMKFGPDMFDGMLPDEVQPFAESMIRAATIWGEFFWQWNLPGCNKISSNYTTACVTGDRIYSNGYLWSDNTVNALCGTSYEGCGQYNYTFTYGGDEIMIVGGGCMFPDRVTDCEKLNNYTKARGIDTFKSCQSSFCEGSYCGSLEATPPEGCNLFTSDDVQLYPGCTLKQTMETFWNCHQQFYTNFPYDDKAECSDKSRQMAQCLAEAHTKCLSGRCPTVLDQIPGYRAYYPMALDLVFNATSMEEILHRMWANGYIDEEMSTQIMGYWTMATCPDIKDLPTMVEAWMSNFNSTMLAQWFVSMDIDLVALQNAMPCSMSYYTSIAAAYQKMIGQFFNSEDTSDMCQAYGVYFDSVTKAYQENCDSSKMDDFLYVLMPDYLDEMVPYVIKAFEYIGKSFYENPEPWWCSNNGGGSSGGNNDVTTVSCDHLYKSKSKCGMKKAWLCDYAKWKFDFLGNWLQEYVNYESDSMMGVDMDMMPPCYKMSDYQNLCKNRRQMTCFQIPVIDCPMCMCKDHEYNDLSGLTTYYRDDYRMWQKFFAAYRNSYGSSHGHSSNGKCDV